MRLRIGKDVIAGLINAVVNVPDGLASAALAGVNPVCGLYTSIAAPAVGGSLASAQLMQIATTSAAALAAGQAVAELPPQQRAAAMFLLVVLTGLWLILFGLLRLGRLMRFVSHAVMTGFLLGVAVVLILDQLAPLCGVKAEGDGVLLQALKLLGGLEQVSLQTLAIGGLALTIITALARTRLAGLSSLLALILPTLTVLLLGWDEVQRVGDVSAIPRGLPPLSPPRMEFFDVELLFSAAAVAVVIAVQGAGVSQTVENPDGRPVNVSRDLLAQGAGNVAAGLISGIPAGGSVGQTALNVKVGARSRWAGICSGVWMLIIVMSMPGLVGYVPMTVLAALMIVSGVSAIDPAEAYSIWRTGGAGRWSILVTFLATLVLSIPQAVALGVALSVLLYLAEAASDVTVLALVRQPNGDIAETKPPQHLASRTVTVFNVYGSLFFAGARTLREALPTPAGSEQAVVVLRLRGRSRLGSTLIDVLDDYAEDLAAAGGRLYLAGTAPEVTRQLQRSGKLAQEDVVRVLPAETVIGAAPPTLWQMPAPGLAGNEAPWRRVRPRALENTSAGSRGAHDNNRAGR